MDRPPLEASSNRDGGDRTRSPSSRPLRNGPHIVGRRPITIRDQQAIESDEHAHGHALSHTASFSAYPNASNHASRRPQRQVVK